MTMACEDELHPMYEPNCPACNPTGYAELLSRQPQHVGQTDSRPVEQPSSETPGGYSDTY